jgi:hypothetical protein
MSGGKMTNDDIIRMAREAEFCDASELDLNVEWTCSFSELQHFANLVAAVEREACAKVVEEWLHGEWHNQGVVATTMIRARGQV